MVKRFRTWWREEPCTDPGRGRAPIPHRWSLAVRGSARSRVDTDYLPFLCDNSVRTTRDASLTLLNSCFASVLEITHICDDFELRKIGAINGSYPARC
jgi:hypothetical protein